ncbi:hypothetical protein [Amycolatopsis sp. NPDC051071]|uniref:hypothetical protein n=1 Tax=Amycolatopsis sp. NPDC051071 TaxID=3154637 RepID=UPI003422C991
MRRDKHTDFELSGNERTADSAGVGDVLGQPRGYRFVVDPRWAPVLAWLRPATARCGVRVDADGFTARFGPWTVRTGLDNIADARLTGPFRAWRAIGPRLSLADRGLTFGTNTLLAVCVRFHHPVRGIDPFGLVRHPSLTVTVAEPQILARQLRAIADGSRPAREVLDGVDDGA